MGLPATCPPSASPSGEAGGSQAQAKRAGQTGHPNRVNVGMSFSCLPCPPCTENDGMGGMPDKQQIHCGVFKTSCMARKAI